MPYSLGLSSSSYLAADGAVGPSGARIRLFQATWLSDGTARDLVLRNGDAEDDTIWITAAGTISKTVTVSFGKEGLVFPDGCFFDIGSAVSGAFTYRVEL
jgi:hypothetical protein